MKYFETKPRAMTKQLRWHNTLAPMDMELICKTSQNNVVRNTLSCKEEYNQKPSTKIKYLWVIIVGKNIMERNIRETYVVDLLAQHYFMELQTKKKIRGISFKKGLIKLK